MCVLSKVILNMFELCDACIGPAQSVWPLWYHDVLCPGNRAQRRSRHLLLCRGDKQGLGCAVQGIVSSPCLLGGCCAEAQHGEEWPGWPKSHGWDHCDPDLPNFAAHCASLHAGHLFLVGWDSSEWRQRGRGNHQLKHHEQSVCRQAAVAPLLLLWKSFAEDLYCHLARQGWEQGCCPKGLEGTSQGKLWCLLWQVQSRQLCQCRHWRQRDASCWTLLRLCLEGVSGWNWACKIHLKKWRNSRSRNESVQMRKFLPKRCGLSWFLARFDVFLYRNRDCSRCSFCFAPVWCL